MREIGDQREVCETSKGRTGKSCTVPHGHRREARPIVHEKHKAHLIQPTGAKNRLRIVKIKYASLFPKTLRNFSEVYLYDMRYYYRKIYRLPSGYDQEGERLGVIKYFSRLRSLCDDQTVAR